MSKKNDIDTHRYCTPYVPIQNMPYYMFNTALLRLVFNPSNIIVEKCCNYLRLNYVLYSLVLHSCDKIHTMWLAYGHAYCILICKQHCVCLCTHVY